MHLNMLFAVLAAFSFVIMSQAEQNYWRKKRYLPVLIALIIFILMEISVSPMIPSILIRDLLLFVISGFFTWLILIGSEV